MKFIQGKDRNQVSFFCLEEQIDDNNEVWFIELFVNSIHLADAGFKMDFIENGRPAYNLRRIFNILHRELLKEYLKALALYFPSIWSFF